MFGAAMLMASAGKKLEPKADKYIFIGYPKVTVGYTFYLRSKDKKCLSLRTGQIGRASCRERV